MDIKMQFFFFNRMPLIKDASCRRKVKLETEDATVDVDDGDLRHAAPTNEAPLTRGRRGRSKENKESRAACLFPLAWHLNFVSLSNSEVHLLLLATISIHFQIARREPPQRHVKVTLGLQVSIHG